MRVDTIVLTNTANQDYYDMTSRCIKSLQESEDTVEFRPIVVESGGNLWSYPGVTLQVPPPFNYNKSLNAGLNACTSDFVIVSNNDVMYSAKWFSEILNGMEKYKLNTASPRCTLFRLHAGYDDTTVLIGWQVSSVFTGFCLVLDKLAQASLYPLDLNLHFAYQDNDMANILSSKGLRHGLIGSAKIQHLCAQSHKLVDAQHLNRISQIYYEEKYK